MRLFYTRYKNFQPLDGNLSWSHYVELICLNNQNKINHYIKIIEEYNQSYRELHQKIKNQEYERSYEETKDKK